MPSELGEKSLVVPSSTDLSQITVNVASSISTLTEKNDLFLDSESVLWKGEGVITLFASLTCVTDEL